MLPTPLSLRGHAAWDKFILYIIYAFCVYNPDIGTKLKSYELHLKDIDTVWSLGYF